MLKAFAKHWPNLDLTNYTGLLEIESELLDLKEDCIIFYKSLLAKKEYFRDDYLEFIELNLLVLGSPPEKIHFRKPGACHRARFMAPCLYILKMFLFRQ